MVQVEEAARPDIETVIYLLKNLKNKPVPVPVPVPEEEKKEAEEAKKEEMAAEEPEKEEKTAGRGLVETEDNFAMFTLGVKNIKRLVMRHVEYIVVPEPTTTEQ